MLSLLRQTAWGWGRKGNGRRGGEEGRGKGREGGGGRGEAGKGGAGGLGRGRRRAGGRKGDKHIVDYRCKLHASFACRLT